MSAELLKLTYRLVHKDGHELQTDWKVDGDGDIWVERVDGGKLSYKDRNDFEGSYDGLYLNIEEPNCGYEGIKDFPVSIIPIYTEQETVDDSDDIAGFGIL